MKITNIIAIASAAVLIVACGAPKVEGSAEVKALLPSAKQIDSASYLMGVNIGSFLKGNDFGEVDYNLFIKGIKDFVNAKGDMRDSTFNDQFKISPEKMNEVLDPFLQKRRAYRTALNGEKGAQYIEKFLQEEGAQKTESGIAYKVIDDGAVLPALAFARGTETALDPGLEGRHEARRRRRQDPARHPGRTRLW